MPLPPDAGPVLPWAVHDKRHSPEPITGSKLYMLDYVSDEPDLACSQREKVERRLTALFDPKCAPFEETSFICH